MTDLVKRLTRYRRWRDSDGNHTGAMVDDEGGGWVRYGPAAERIEELKAQVQFDEDSIKKHADEHRKLQRKHEALVTRVKAVVDQHHFGNSVPKALILAALEDDDE